MARRVWRRRRDRVHRRFGEELAGAPARSEEEARRELSDAFGGYEALVAQLEPRLREQAGVITHRGLDAKTASQSARDLANRLLDRWAEAHGEVPRLRRELPPETWSVACTPEAIVKDWKKRAARHDGKPRGPFTEEELRAEPTMAPLEFVDWNVDWWVSEVRQQTAIGCFDVLFLPPFFVAVVATMLSKALNPWVAFGLALVFLVPFMWGWTWVRRRGSVSVGDD